jgi:hypothetical protein
MKVKHEPAPLPESGKWAATPIGKKKLPGCEAREAAKML